MKNKRKAIVPAGYNKIMPYLRVRGADKAIKFYKAAFGAREKYRLNMGGRIGHAELKIGDAIIMLSDEFPAHGAYGPKTFKGTPVTISIYVANVDKTAAAAKSAGAKIVQPPRDEFYGDRTARIEDPFGHVWSIQKRIEDVSPRQMQKRLDAMMAAGAAPRRPPAPRAKRAPAKTVRRSVAAKRARGRRS